MANDVEQNDRRESYTASAGQTVFDYTFPITDADDLSVYVNGTLQESGYTVDLTAGAVTFDAGLSLDDNVVIEGDTAQVRTSSFPILGKLRTAILNGDFRKIFYILQELVRDSGRSLQLNKSTPDSVSASLPVLDEGKAIIWGANGLENSQNSFGVVDNLVDEVTALKDAAEAFKDAASASASAASSSASAASGSADTAEDWAIKTDGAVSGGEYSSKAYAVGGTGTETNNAKYYRDQAELIAGPATLDPLDVAAPALDDYLAFGDTSDSDTVKRNTLQVISQTIILDEDNMASDDATRPPSQQSVKAYVDTEIAGIPEPSYPVTTVNTQTGDVVLDKTDIGLSNVQNVDQTNASNLSSGTVPGARLLLSGGSVGSYGLLRRTSAGSEVSFGSTLAGSALSPSDVDNSNSGTVSGTWRCMGYQTGNTGATLWQRIS